MGDKYFLNPPPKREPKKMGGLGGALLATAAKNIVNGTMPRSKQDLKSIGNSAFLNSNIGDVDISARYNKHDESQNGGKKFSLQASYRF